MLFYSYFRILLNDSSFTPVPLDFISSQLDMQISTSHQLCLYYLIQYHKQSLASARVDIYESLYDKMRIPQILDHARESGSTLSDSMYSIVSHYFPHLLLDAESILKDQSLILEYLVPPKLLLGERLDCQKLSSLDVGSLESEDLICGMALYLSLFSYSLFMRRFPP
jgi:hypothetical protein